MMGREMVPDLAVELLAGQIAALRVEHTLRVALDGIDAAGKTTLADELAGSLEAIGRPVIRASVDGFHHPSQERYRRENNPAASYFHDSFDYPALVERLLAPLGPGGDGCFQRAVFDYRSDQVLKTDVEQAPAGAVLLFDGIFLLRPELRAYWDFTIFVEVSFETALERAVQRDATLFGSAAAARERYQERYFPGQRLYLESCRPKRLADVVLKNHDWAGRKNGQD